MPRSLTDEQVKELHREYMAGASSTELANKTGLANLTIRRNFLRLGLTVRSHSDARKNMWKSVTPKEKAHYVKAAHDKVRGQKRSMDELCKRALTREKWPTAFSDQEKHLARSLKLSTLEHSFQKACGPFNIDFAVEGKVAIEVFGGNWHGTGRHAQRFKRRSECLLKDGWHIIIIWLVKQRHKHWPAILRNMYALIDELKNDKTPSIRTILADGKYKGTGAVRME
jgi:very-short-patch-repair endonuclease